MISKGKTEHKQQFSIYIALRNFEKSLDDL